MYKAYEIRAYKNKLQGYNYKVLVKAYKVRNREEIKPTKVSKITVNDMIDFERSIGRELLLTYNDLKFAEEKDIYKLEYDVDDDVIISYYIIDRNRGSEKTYIEIYKSGKCINRLRFNGSPEEVIRQLKV